MWFGVSGKPGIRLLARRGGVALVTMLVSTIAVPAAAQEISDQALEQSNLGTQASGKWDINLGAGVGTAPAYPGAKRERVVPVPFASIAYDNLFFVGPLGLGFNALRWASADTQYGFRAGPVIGYVGGRKESVDPHLAGLGDIQPSLTAGLFATFRAGPFEFAATARQAVTHSENGLLGLVSLSYHLPVVAKKLDFAIGPQLTVANERYSNTWFGVSADQSARSGLSMFTPGSGVLLEPGLHANATYRYSEHVFVRGFAAVKQLTGNDADSPIVQSKAQWSIGLGAGYHF
jgi:MipA family protein